MKTKRSTLRLILHSCLAFLGVFIASCSTQDHVVPENPAEASIRTLDATVNPILGINSLRYGAQFQVLGTIPVVEHGVVRIFQQVGSAPAAPTVADVKLVISEAADLNVQFQSEAVSPLLVTQVSYRAYAILGNGKVVYGDVKTRLTLADNPVEPTITTLEASALSGGNMRFSLVVQSNNTVPVTEYGVLYKINNNEMAAIVPTESDTKLVFTTPFSLDVKSETTNVGDPGTFVFYRAYAKLINGNTIYGQVKVKGTTPQ